MNLDGARILVTGGTGSFGTRFASKVLSKFRPEMVAVLSRDEMKQWNMQEAFAGESALRFFIGDVRDLGRLRMAFRGIDIVVHAAALKIVPTAEYNPFEAVKTNVQGAMNVIEAALETGVSRVVALSTDKASSPVNLYGATKLVSDKLFTAANSYAGGRGTSFSVVRYGNVLGSRGSVVPFFRRRVAENKPIPITSPEMTRFMLTLDQGVEMVLKAINEMDGSEIFVRKIPSMSIMDIAEAIAPGSDIEIIGVRPGEKIHEQMISPEDAPRTVEFDDHFRIYPSVSGLTEVGAQGLGGKVVKNDFSYSSNTNTEWMSIEELRALSKNLD